MFDTKLFGYDKEQVEAVIELMNTKIDSQQKDIDYLRIEKNKLERKMKKSKENIDDDILEK